LTRVYTKEDARKLSLPGRSSMEIASGRMGADGVSLRLVEIAVPKPGDPERGPHVHYPFEEVIFVLSGEGCTETDGGSFPLKAGDTIVVSAGEWHATRNTGAVPLQLLCFFPVADIAPGTEEFPDWSKAKVKAP
jgi:mannose-6-phosphate isomerase-like protein (cupin superfamily)